jgi:site-specific DNA recombinase
MSRSNGHARASGLPAIRCAIYTRKSTEEGLEQEFNSLDAQRESAEAFIASQQHEGWTCLAERYDDGGYTGGNMDRPGLARLMADIEAGRVDCVVVYKVDRLSRSLLDFARMMEAFERHQVSFVSVTQQFNTSTPMGRLMLNVLLSFAQFEREIISERTRDKIAATRRKGKWSGGRPLLGYDVVSTKLVVNAEEAGMVCQIFALYLAYQALLPVVQELARRGWTTKRWTTKKGKVQGGRPFTKNRLYELLTNVVYIGKVRYKSEVHAGEHDAIVDEEVFRQVQAMLAANGTCGGRQVRNKHGALLRGLVRCKACGCGMTHSFSKRGPRLYRYYVCHRAQQNGWGHCPSPSIPAGEIERWVVEQIRTMGRDPGLLAETLAQARRQSGESIERLEKERSALRQQVRLAHGELGLLPGIGMPESERIARAADLNEQVSAVERRLGEIQGELLALERERIDETAVGAALVEFDGVWESLTPREQARVIELLVERVEYDGREGTVAITLRPSGIRVLPEQHGESGEERP